MATLIRSRNVRSLAAAVVALGALVGMSGCENAVQGGITGAGLGALAGMGLGSLSGDMGKGAAAGAILGGLAGTYIGDQNYRRGYDGGGYSYGGGSSYGGGYYRGGWGGCGYSRGYCD